MSWSHFHKASRPHHRNTGKGRIRLPIKVLSSLGGLEISTLIDISFRFDQYTHPRLARRDQQMQQYLRPESYRLGTSVYTDASMNTCTTQPLGDWKHRCKNDPGAVQQKM
jgi:hypothetical protein